ANTEIASFAMTSSMRANWYSVPVFKGSCMLSYRHGFHAGNIADVHKHWQLLLLLKHLRQKDKPFFVMDTHAGDGLYDLQHASAQKTTEYEQGIGRLWEAKALPDSLAAYREQVAVCNAGGKLRWYPGSPVLIARQLRDGDTAVF